MSNLGYLRGKDMYFPFINKNFSQISHYWTCFEQKSSIDIEYVT